MLALESGGTQGEIEAMANALAVAKSSADLDLSQAHPRLAAMLSMVRNIEREPLAEAAKRVAPIAATFSFRS
jgi:2-oxo-4-hydroxy-4-carboxy--5-ureidoimidazoline (OHCU) decarboxylase